MKSLYKYGAIVLVGLAALTGCSSGDNTVSPQGDGAKAPDTAATATPTNAQAKFGDKVTFPDGVSVVVTGKSQAAGQYASGAIDGKITVFSIAVTNGSKKDLNAALMSVPKVTYGAGGTVAMTAADGAASMTVLSTIQPGETQTATAAYGIPTKELGNVRVEITGPNTFTDKPAIIKGAIK